MKRHVDLGGREVTIVGTAHVSQESRDEVKNTIEEEDPDLVCVELDESRFNSLREDSGWEDLDVSEAMRNGDGKLLLLNLLLSIYQKKIGLQEGMKPGEELMAAVEKAEEKDIEYALVDRDINVTLSRAMSSLSLWEKIKIVASFLTSEEEVTVEDLKEDSMLNKLIEELEEEFPSVSRVFLDERNDYMAEKILEKDFEKAVVVVGAAHAEGLAQSLESASKYEVEEVSGFPWRKVLGYGIPALIVLGIGYSFYTGFSQGARNLGVWVWTNSILAAVAAMVARSHPLTWLTSFIISPITSLNPVLPAGGVAAYVEAKINPPTVGELEEVSKISDYRELWNNQVGVILLTFLFVNLGSGGAAIISGLFILVTLLLGI